MSTRSGYLVGGCGDGNVCYNVFQFGVEQGVTPEVQEFVGVVAMGYWVDWGDETKCFRSDAFLLKFSVSGGYTEILL